jgi:hypothetical protein
MLLELLEPFSLGLEFKHWAAQLSARDYPQADIETLLAFRTWVGQLPDSQTERMAQEIARVFCLPGFSLDWFQENLRHPQPGSHQSRALVYFGLSVYQRWTCLHHLQILAWIKNPKWRRKKEFGWQLYLLLVEAGFTSMPGEFLMAPNTVRAGIIEKAIRQAYEQDYILLVALTREILFLQSYNSRAKSKQEALTPGTYPYQPFQWALPDLRGN